MQPVTKKPSRGRQYAAVITLAIVLLLVLYLFGLFGGARKLSAKKLRCIVTQSVTPFGDRVLYYDGSTLYCLSSGGADMWKYTLGEDASFHVSDGFVAAWAGTQLYILDRNGRSTYNDRLPDPVQFARAGSRYVAVVMGESASPSLLVKDMDGITVDSETNAYEDKLILDMGFFGNGEYLWTTALDVYGTVPDIILNTFRVGQMNTGEVDLGEPFTYAVVYAGDKLNIINTRQMRLYDYRGTLDATSSVLVYGWQLIDHAISSNGGAMLLFVPVLQTGDSDLITELRVLYGKTDNRYTLPDTCVGAAIRKKTLYAFSGNSLYRADISSQRFSALTLPTPPVTEYLGMLSNGVALLGCGNDVYAVTLP
jgi:hypothetical protein